MFYIIWVWIDSVSRLWVVGPQSTKQCLAPLSAKVGVGLCGFCVCSPLTSFAGEEGGEEKKIDLAERNSCGYKCPEDCGFLCGTLARIVHERR